MDAVTTGLSIIKDVSKSLMAKLEQIEQLEKHELEFARDYRTSIRVLAEETNGIELQLFEIIETGDSVAVSKLLGSEGGSYGALTDLSKSLHSVHKFLKQKDVAVAELLTKLPARKGKSMSRIIVEVLTANNREASFNDAKEGALATLAAHSEELQRRFLNFRNLHEIVSARKSTTSLEFSPGDFMMDHKDRGFLRREIGFASNAHPFHLTLTESLALQIASDIDLSSSASAESGLYPSLMREKGLFWVQENLQNPSTFSNVGDLQVSLLENLAKNIHPKSSPTEPVTKASLGGLGDIQSNDNQAIHLEGINDMILKEIKRIKEQRFCIAICGMVKAGKSTFLNAIIGQDILPSDGFVTTTAWPCRIRHVAGLAKPMLTLDPKYLQSRALELQKKKYGARMEHYKPPIEENRYDALFEAVPDGPILAPTSKNIREAEEALGIYRNWIDLHANTKRNLKRIEGPNFALPDKAEGAEDVTDLLGLINDIVRLCWRFHVPLEKSHKLCGEWPLLTVEFDAFRSERNTVQVFEFLDLPGFGEKTDFFEFEELVREAAGEANAIVPIVSFNEFARDEWRQQLSRILKTVIGGPPDLVLCSYLDCVPRERVNDMAFDIAKTFAPYNENCLDLVSTCATRRGISARLLLQVSEGMKPDFSDITRGDSLFHDCAKEILGSSSKLAKRKFDRMSLEQWKDAIRKELDKSRLPATISRLIRDLVAVSQKNLLIKANEVLRKQIQKNYLYQYRSVEAARRSQLAFEEAVKEFHRVKNTLLSILATWVREQELEKKKTRDNLSQGFTHSRDEYRRILDDIVDNRIKEFALSGKMIIISEAENSAEKLEFISPFHADLFLDTIKGDVSGKLANAKEKLVEFVRNLASSSHSSYFRSLTEKIKKSIGNNDLTLQFKDDLIGDLEEKGSNIQALTSRFLQIRKNAMHKAAIRHTPRTAFQAIEASIAKPLIPSSSSMIEVLKNENELEDAADDINSSQRSNKLDELGFMLRAPITILASVAWVIGVGFWPFMKQSEKIFMRKTDFTEQLHKHLLSVFFEDLQEEGRETLELIMDKSWRMAKSVVEEKLKSEDMRYENEKILKQNGRDRANDQLTALLPPLLNYLAAESALAQLHSECVKL
ncbi:hypothetical protein SCHPADRAFT_995240 [Schizopora paradoxa]|uniref:Dynamin N-terminal domain-containing protein n=1 Tax=Schizopora paradoxa TaxID=27342 RepID=A0A0H2S3E3_9AGAM|nr:hypothetical protein SCHPADRAFT_995240 [Schizopora paradoxa]